MRAGRVRGAVCACFDVCVSGRFEGGNTNNFAHIGQVGGVSRLREWRGCGRLIRGGVFGWAVLLLKLKSEEGTRIGRDHQSSPTTSVPQGSQQKAAQEASLHLADGKEVVTMASLRLAGSAGSVPRAGLSFHSKQLQQRWLIPSIGHSIIRHASTERPPPPKPRVLEKPDKFRPPSHPSRIRSKPRYNYGPDLTHEQKTVRQYPHMMPPEGTFMHWFLTNRTIHLYISLVGIF